MKTLIPLLVFCLVTICNAELRTWKSIVGTKVEAELVSLTGNQVTLKTKAGKTLKLPLNKLSKADQEFLKAKSSPREQTKEETPVNPNIEYKIKDGTVTITGSDYFTHEEFIIPAKIEGKPVTNIGKKAFQASELTSITIPDSVTSIGEHAFRASDLTSMKIPDSVTSIGDKAFSTCINLTSITIPHSVTSIGDEAFSHCESLTSITIPHSVPSIGYWAFQNCISLAAVTFLGNAPKVDPNVFAGSTPTIYRKPEAKGWGDTFAGRPVKLISEKP